MLFDPRDWEIETEIEVGNDDFIFGNYVDWNRFRHENEDELLDFFGVELPWDKTLTLYEYIEFVSQDVFQNSDICKNFLKDGFLIEEKSEILSDILIKFISRTSEVSDDIISNIFDYYGVPSGIDYEYELPEHLRYWQKDFSEFDYGYYRKYPIKVEEYEETINDIFDKIASNADVLTKKSLVLSSLIITESMFKSVLVEKIPQDNEVSEFDKEILQAEVDRILRGNNEGKNKLFKKLYNNKAPSQNWIDLRNSLAHDIESPSICGNEITYLNLKTDIEEKYSVSDLKEHLIEFCNNLKNIICSQ